MNFLLLNKLNLSKIGQRYPDLNPIEKCWNLAQIQLDKLLAETKPRNKQQLFALVKEAWNLVSNESVINIFNSFNKFLRKVVDNNGCNNFKS